MAGVPITVTVMNEKELDKGCPDFMNINPNFSIISLLTQTG